MAAIAIFWGCASARPITAKISSHIGWGNFELIPPTRVSRVVGVTHTLTQSDLNCISIYRVYKSNVTAAHLGSKRRKPDTLLSGRN